MLKILVADDHPVLREGLKKIIEQTRDMVVAAEASNGQEVLRRMSKISPDVVLLDLSMPGMNGIEILKQIRAKFPKQPVLILSQHSEDQYALRALRAGASGYLTKERASKDLIAAIRKVAGGGKSISEAVVEQLASSLDEDFEKLPHEFLSDREYEILCLLGNGKTVSGIAEDLCLSVKTISTYRTRILEKMNMTKTNELIRYTLQQKLISA